MPTRRKRWLMENDGYQEMGTCSRESFSVLPFFTFRRACGYEVWIYFKAHTDTVQMGLYMFFFVRFDRIYDIKTYSSDLCRCSSK